MPQEKNKQIPLMLLSDATTSGTGLGRITGDLALRIATNMSDVFRVATLGYGGMASRKLPYHVYTIEGMRDWVIESLPEIWNDWAGDEEGILLTVWDASRLGWLSQPDNFHEVFGKDMTTLEWLMKRPFKLWGYFPVDGSGPNDRLTFPLMKTLYGFDRLIAYGQFGEDVIRRTLGDADAEARHITNLPHGIDSSVFHKSDRKMCRDLFFQLSGAVPLIGQNKPLGDDEVLIGCVSTNQGRKDLSLVAETFSILAKTRNCRLWLNTDALEKFWSIPSLLVDFGILDKTVISLRPIPDENMAACYSACDITIGPGSEGFGFPLMESQFCGTPVVAGSYAGGGDIVPKGWKVDPIAIRYEGSYAIRRPIYNAQEWASKANELIGKRCNYLAEYAWGNLWPRWEAYLREAVK